MPGIVKVGYSSKDPELRAAELSHTGTPHPYVVEYEALVAEPAQIEAKAHALLKAQREGKEWFKCSAEVAVSAILEAAQDSIIIQNFKKTDRQAAQEKYALKLKKRQEEDHLREAEIQAEALLEERIKSTKGIYEPILKKMCATAPFWQYWLGCTAAMSFFIFLAKPNIKEGSAFFLGSVLGAPLALWLQEFTATNARQSEKYKAVQQQLANELESLHKPSTKCSNCGSNVVFDPIKLLTSTPERQWQCGKCDETVYPPQLNTQ